MPKSNEFGNLGFQDTLFPPTGPTDIGSVDLPEIHRLTWCGSNQESLDLDTPAVEVNHASGQELVEAASMRIQPWVPIRRVVEFQKSMLKEPKEGIRVELREEGKKRKRRRKKVVRPPVPQIDASGVSTVPGTLEEGVHWVRIGQILEEAKRQGIWQPER